MNRFVWQLRPQLFEALEFLYRAPSQALGLSLVAQEQLNVVALAVEVKEAIGEAVLQGERHARLKSILKPLQSLDPLRVPLMVIITSAMVLNR